jgi:preprotein translocase subunit SecE
MEFNKASIIYYVKHVLIFVFWFVIGFLGINLLLSLGD